MFVSLLLISCERIYINGELDGLWKLERAQSADGVEYPADIYYSFQRHLVILGKYYEEGFPEYYMAEFDKKGDTMTMTNFYKYPGNEGVCDMKDLEKYYIFSDTMVFVLDELDRGLLLMHTDRYNYGFRKW